MIHSVGRWAYVSAVAVYGDKLKSARELLPSLVHTSRGLCSQDPPAVSEASVEAEGPQSRLQTQESEITVALGTSLISGGAPGNWYSTHLGEVQ